jgi:hypothetical protein
MSDFVRTMLPIRETPGTAADAALRAARAEDEAQQLNPTEAEILFSSLPPERQSEIQRQALAHSPGATRTTIGPDGPVTEELGVIRYDSREPLPGVTDPILLTARNALTGQRRGSWVELKDSDTIQIGGIEVRCDTAARTGLLVKDRDGHYTPPSAATPEQVAAEAAEKAAADAENAPVVFMSPELAQCVENLDGLTGSAPASDHIVASVLARAATGKDTGRPLVTELGYSPEDAQHNVDLAIQDGVKSAGEFLSRVYGVDGPATLAYIAQNFSATEKASLALGMYKGSRDAFNRAAEIGRKLARAQAHPAK